MNFLLNTLVILISLMSFQSHSKDISKGIVGKIVKTEEKTEGSEYFIIYTSKDKVLAFPISPDSKVKNLKSYIGETVKVFGTTSFKKTQRSETSHLMFFEVDKIQGLSLKDLAYKPEETTNDHKVSFFLSPAPEPVAAGVKIKNINDDVANTAIFVGGAILAADVLSKILK